MQGKRTDRIADLIRGELSRVILTRMRDPRVGFLTIARVEVSADLQHAKVFYSVLGRAQNGTVEPATQALRIQTQEALDHARGFLQKDLAQVLNFRYTPHLHFVLDESVDQSIEIGQILRRIQDESTESQESSGEE
jgi:ribosome-binding factor A